MNEILSAPGTLLLTVGRRRAVLGSLSETKVKIKEPEVTLTSDGAVMMLLDKNTFTVAATLPAPLPDSSTIEIRRASKPGTWYKLGDGPTKTDWQAKIAGLMKVRANAVIKGYSYYSEESDLEIEFPAYSDIEANGDVRTATDNEWAATKKYATDSYNDNGMDPAKASINLIAFESCVSRTRQSLWRLTAVNPCFRSPFSGILSWPVERTWMHFRLVAQNKRDTLRL